MHLENKVIVITGASSGIGQALLPDFIGGSDDALERRTVGPPELVRRLRILVPRHLMQAPTFRAVKTWVFDSYLEHFPAISGRGANKGRNRS